MNDFLRPDPCILGGAAAGAALAVRAATFGLGVVLVLVLVEKSRLGGTRPEPGLARDGHIEASRFLASMREAGRFGLDIDVPRIDFARVENASLEVAASRVRVNAPERLEALGVEIIAASGRFGGRDRLDAGPGSIEAGCFVVATGSLPAPLRVPGIDLIRPLDRGSLCASDRPPRHLLVIGTDPPALALAQAYCRFGSEVTISTRSPLFAVEDEELVAPVRARFVSDGISLLEGVSVSRIEPKDEGLRAHLAPAGAGHAGATGRTRVLRWPFAETDRAIFGRRTEGHVEIDTTAGGKVIGAGMVGPAAGELINLCALAISSGMSAADLAALMVPSPAPTDALRAAAAGQETVTRGASSTRYALRILRWL